MSKSKKRESSVKEDSLHYKRTKKKLKEIYSIDGEDLIEKQILRKYKKK